MTRPLVGPVVLSEDLAHHSGNLCNCGKKLNMKTSEGRIVTSHLVAGLLTSWGSSRAGRRVVGWPLAEFGDQPMTHTGFLQLKPPILAELNAKSIGKTGAQDTPGGS